MIEPRDVVEAVMFCFRLSKNAVPVSGLGESAATGELAGLAGETHRLAALAHAVLRCGLLAVDLGRLAK